ncbi:MAG: cytochrome P460 family protein [Rhodobacteraceae bacterium]|nr:cytochrome P460 family protein [Paracoccaceae bacterium]
MNRLLKAAAITATAILASGSAWAADCPVTVLDPFDLEAGDINSIYDCMKDDLAAGYASQGSKVAENYRNWTATATRMAVAGPHGSRLLLTFANPIGAETYLKFEEEGVNMPAGSVLAKESIKIHKKKKKAVAGPLFLMTKVAAGELPDTNDWRYDALTPSGKVMKIKQSFCHDCHLGFEDQDYLGYPVEEVRVSN